MPSSGWREYLWDKEVKGFGLMVTDRGIARISCNIVSVDAAVKLGEGRLAGIVALATGQEAPETLTAKMERVKGIEPSS